MLSKKIQERLAKNLFVGPVNKNVRLEGDLSKIVPYGPEGVAKLGPLDGGAVAKSLQKSRTIWDEKVSAK